MSAVLTGQLRTIALQKMRQGLPPPPKVARALFVGGDELLATWERDLKEYVIPGGSLLRVLAAPYGGGKTHVGLAVQSMAAELGMLLAAVDVQADSDGGGELTLYRGIYANLTSPTTFLSGDSAARRGLAGILEEASGRLGSDVAITALRKARVPLPFYRDVLCYLLQTASTPTAGRLALVSALGGDTSGLSLTALRARHTIFATAGVQRLPGKRDARLWTETLLACLRALGYPGVMLTLDEHDEFQARKTDLNIVRLRSKLDALAAGALPGTFILYLVLESFRERVKQAHAALDQRLRPLLQLEPGKTKEVRRKMAPQLYSHIADWQQLEGRELYAAIADRLVAEPVSASLRRQLEALIEKNARNLAQRSLRPYVQELSALIEDADD